MRQTGCGSGGARRGWRRGALAGLAAAALVAVPVAVTPAAATVASAPSSSTSAPSAAQTAAAGAQASPSGTQAPPPLPRSAVPAGPVAPTTPVPLTVLLPSRDPAGLNRLAAAVSTPGSPEYRHFLTPSEFASRYGASAATAQAATDELAARHLSVGPVAGNGLSIAVQGSASTVGAAFSTHLVRHRLADGRTVFSNDTPAVLPRDVAGVIGLDNVAIAARPPVATTPHLPGGPPFSACPAAAGDGGYAPSDIATAYGLNGLYSSGKTGAGQTVALLELADYSAADVARYEACMGVSPAPTVTRLSLDGGAPVGSGTAEATSDIEMVVGLAPGARVLVYESPNTTQGVYDNFAAQVGQGQAQVISTSWGLCEADSPPDFIQGENQLFQEAAVQGQTVVAAGGDAGAQDCYAPPGDTNQSQQVDDPASQPWVTSVGGTSLSSVSPRTETTWNDVYGASGGGVSHLWPMPSYQAGVVGAGSTGAPCGAASGDCREVPDVSASADPGPNPNNPARNNGYDAYCTAGDCSPAPGWVAVGGTSLAVPVWGSLVAVINQGCPQGPAGFLNPTLYAHRSALNDITAGNNGFVGPGYNAGPGYDMATGLGSPAAAALQNVFCGQSRTAPSPPPTPAPNPTGYHLVASDGGVFSFGGDQFYGSTGAIRLNQPVVGMAATPDRGGYWLVASDGGIFTFGDAGFFGSTGAMRLNKPVVGMAATPSGHGYWLVASDGGIFTFGDARFFGSTGAMRLNQPVVGMAATPSGHGYWLVASDGGIFTFGDARFLGSGAASPLSAPVVGMSALPGGGGYRLLTASGQVVPFGAAALYSPDLSAHAAAPFVGILTTSTGNGYWTVTRLGEVFAYGDARYSGSLDGLTLAQPVVGVGG